MQATRKRILDILKERGQVTVDELSQELDLTTVTVRHHLDILRGDGLIAAPFAHRRKAPGRPKYIYTLTEKTSTFFPKRYDHLSRQMMKRIGEHIASQAVLPDEGDFEARLAAVVEFLNELGYMARWEHRYGNNYWLHIANCPYEHVARHDPKVCKIDVTLLTRLLGASPQRISWAAQGDHQCTYAIQPPGE
jgi:predicted ArsR family transcriptional regulator